MRRSSSRSMAAVVVLSLTSALTFALVTSAGATPPDLATDAAISAYLQSIGVNPLTAVWQGTTDAPSHKNYAGPGCPGSGWNCVAANAPIVQVTDAGGTNLFACGGLDCVVVQVALSGGQNGGTCLRFGTSIDQTQVCEITQANGGDNPNSTNAAGISQNIQQSGGSTQNARQVARITQENTVGKNIAHIHQVIGQRQDTKNSATITQSQDAHQAATVDQETTEGDNTSNITERQNQSQTARKATTINQNQNTALGGLTGVVCDVPSDTTFDQDKNQCVDVDQNSPLVGGGDQNSRLLGLIEESQNASQATTVNQAQGNEGFPDNGQEGSVDQSSGGVSTSDADQDMTQTATASAVSGSINQDQHIGDPRCCQDQFGNSNNSAEITQTTNQFASEGEDAEQTASLIGECFSSGNCDVQQSATVNGETTTNSCSGSFCAVFIECFDFGSEGEGCEPGVIDETITVDAPIG